MSKINYCIYVTNNIARNIVFSAIKYYNNSTEPVTLYHKVYREYKTGRIVLTTENEIKDWLKALRNYLPKKGEEKVYDAMLDNIEAFVIGDSNTETCKWVKHIDEGAYHTECGITQGELVRPNQKVCYCGKKIERIHSETVSPLMQRLMEELPDLKPHN